MQKDATTPFFGVLRWASPWSARILQYGRYMLWELDATPWMNQSSESVPFHVCER
eukprot:COSAG03_NODE_6149_length_1106_cov_2.576763_3_plen_54_part_01